ncbi:hypothetical protein [Vineibacter terrae]|uniref:hypothetical protein n=1 Tax=Vineibacter terrae TaxID=2586908 RepID=UPI002E31AC0C|nr:hypothetical protein [Vineibacter terrae]HEX2889316.1 hypothetical protein [Vineibacter terrae]
MRDLKEILESLGRLHDSVVCRVSWVPEKGILEFEIEDFFSNFDGLPEYPGCRSGSLVFQEVENARFDLDMVEKRLNVDELSITELAERQFEVSIRFWPNGVIKALCRSATWPDLSFEMKS